jgi:hypothetical protein
MDPDREYLSRFVRGRAASSLGTRGLCFNKGIQELGVYEQICQRKNAASCAGKWEHVGSTSIKVRYSRVGRL